MGKTITKYLMGWKDFWANENVGHNKIENNIINLNIVW